MFPFARLGPRRPFALFLLPTLLFAKLATAEHYSAPTSQPIQDGLIRALPSTCPVAHDGSTFHSFPWTHEPSCADVVLPEDDKLRSATKHKFCVYTNTHYNNGRGISVVVDPGVAASMTSESFGFGIGGLDGQLGQEMGMWEVKETLEKGKGLFAKKDIASIFAGESIIIQTPVLFVSKRLLQGTPSAEKERILGEAILRLPAATRQNVSQLEKFHDHAIEIALTTNGIAVKWPWVDETPELLAIIPEAAVSLTRRSPSILMELDTNERKRINHACRPNSLWRFNDYTLALEVFALEDIRPGEEITLSCKSNHTGPLHSHIVLKMRQDGFEQRSFRRRIRSIEENLGFTCHCQLCSSDADSIDASNERLSEIKALKSVLPNDPEDSPQLIALLPKLISQLEEEGLIFERPRYEEILAYTWSSFGIEERARYWAGRARRHWAVIAGKDSWEQRRCRELEENVTGHSTWMTWKGDPWEGVGQGHPWDEKEGEHHLHDHGHEHSH